MKDFTRLAVRGYFNAEVDVPSEMLDEDFPIDDLYAYIDEAIDGSGLRLETEDFYEV